MVRALLVYLQRLALVFWLGEMLFFAFVFAPVVFKVLPRDQAALLQNNLFPKYYLLGLICAASIFFLEILRYQWSQSRLVFSKKYRPPGRSIFFFVFLGVAAAAFSYSYFVLLPNFELIARDSEEFKLLHSLSTQLNGVALVALLIVLGLL